MKGPSSVTQQSWKGVGAAFLATPPFSVTAFTESSIQLTCVEQPLCVRAGAVHACDCRVKDGCCPHAVSCWLPGIQRKTVYYCSKSSRDALPFMCLPPCVGPGVFHSRHKPERGLVTCPLPSLQTRHSPGMMADSGRAAHLICQPGFPPQCSMGPPSDKTLTFMKDHFLMDEQVVGTPVLVKSGVEYTQLAVETAQGLEGREHLVMYLGTGE